MRVVVWGATALALLTLAGALRTTQVEGTSRSARRLPPSAPDTSIDRSDKTENEPTFRSRNFRRRDETPTQETPKFENPRSRTRQRPQRTETEPDKKQSEGRNEQYESRKTFIRTRSKPVESEVKETVLSKENVRARSRPSYRRTVSTTMEPIIIEATSPSINESKVEVINSSSLDEISRVTIEIETTPKMVTEASQFRRRAPVPAAGETTFARRQGSVYSPINLSPLDLSVSGTMNSLSFSGKEPTTAKTANDIRNSRKLRYKTRLSETETNLTGEGITARKKVTQSSQHKKIINTSQTETQTMAPIVVENIKQLNTDNTRKLTKTMKVIRRPVARGKGSFRPSVALPKKKSSDEISEDDNYPASFKALLQAKNATTQPSSPPSESLSVKESQNVYSTFISPAQNMPTGPTRNKLPRLRSSLRPEGDQFTPDETKPADTTIVFEPNVTPTVPEKPKPADTTTAVEPTDTTKLPEKPKTKVSEYRPRGTYNPRSRKSFRSSTSTTENTPSQSTERPQYKFSRKFIYSTPSRTESSVESNNTPESNILQKKSLVRPSHLHRRKIAKYEGASSEKPSSDNNTSKKKSSKPVLPRTSYYSRLRNNKNDVSSSTETIETSSEPEAQTPAEKKMESSVDSPLIFSLLKRPSEEIDVKNITAKPKVFIIAVSSMESQENNVSSQETTKTIEHTTVYENTPFYTRYQANTNDLTTEPTTSFKADEATVIVTPSTRKIVTRKYGRKRAKSVKSKDTNGDNFELTQKPKERQLRKFSEPVSKSTEPSTNGIPEQENIKSKYSSKYRGSIVDKHYYKPTVPTKTPSTAWLKFFVTDPQLAKSVEEPKWFDTEDIYVTRVTTQTPRRFTAPPSTTYESSLELVEGEEFQIGEMNAISITQSRSTLSSADLILSESLMKQQHTMNVEASQHSPSVTISIFDALADILTSTPRVPRLSSTTEITTTEQNTINTLQTDTFNGVSSNINVNTISGTTLEPFTTVADVNANTKSVHITDQTLNVINSMSARAASMPTNTQDGSTTFVNTPTSTFPPTTPISARKPFAIKFLYSETESPMSTATSSNQPSTDSQTTVYNTVSDILLTNKNLVSPELTSMLSNNIRQIIDGMDPETRTRFSGIDMAKFLNSLIPKAVVGPLTDDNTPETTPYSLEAIKDTENIDISNGVVSFQNVKEEVVVNSTITSTTTMVTKISSTTSPTADVNSTVSMGDLSSTMSGSSSQTTLDGSSLTTSPKETTVLMNTETTPSVALTIKMSPDSTDSDITTVYSDNSLSDTQYNTNITDPGAPIPFFTNAKIVDFESNGDDDLDNNIQATRFNPITLTTQPITPWQGTKTTDDSDTQDPSMVSPLQFWVLSKKAKVLKMIEDLIRQHNNEIATAPPLTELLDQPNNIPLSNRLTEILNTMTSTEFSVNTPTSPMTTPSPPPFPLLTEPIESNTNENGAAVILTTTEGTFSTIGAVVTNIQDDPDITSRVATTSETPPASEIVTIATTTALITEESTKTQETSTTREEIEEQRNTETTTETSNTETTPMIAETTTKKIEETTNISNVESTTQNPSRNTQNDVPIVGNQSNLPTEPPKKDYVIFGILPNNTVVRKDPNEDILESLTEASPYIIYSVLPNNTVIRRFPNGTRVPRVMQKIDVLPISPWSLRNPYSPIHNNPAIVRPRSNPIRVSTNTVTPADSSNNGTENLTNDTVNNQQPMIPSSALNLSDSSSYLGVTTTTFRLPAEKSTASHVLSLRTSTMLPSVDEILLNSLSSAAKEEMLISSMTSSTHEPTILTLDIDPETKQIRTEKPGEGNDSPVFKFISIDEVMVTPEDTNVQKLATKMPTTSDMVLDTTVTESNTQTPQIQTRIENTVDPTTTAQVTVGTPNNDEQTTSEISNPSTMTSVLTTTEPSTATQALTTTSVPTTTQSTIAETPTTQAPTTTPIPTTTQAPTTTPIPTTTQAPTTIPIPTTTQAPTTSQIPITLTTPATTTTPQVTATSFVTATSIEEDYRFLQNLLQSSTERSPKSLSGFNSANQNPFETTTLKTETTRVSSGYQSTSSSRSVQSQEERILQAILNQNSKGTSTISIPSINVNTRVATGALTTTSRSIEDDIKQFEEDTKLLKALLAATGQNPNSINIPSLASLNIPSNSRTTQTTTFAPTITTARTQTTTVSESQILADAKLIQELLQATGQRTNDGNAPIISGITSNVRIASNPQTTQIGSDPTNPTYVRPVYTSRTLKPELTTEARTISTLQPSTTTEVPSTLPPRRPTTPRIAMATARRAPSRFTATTEMPSTSTFSDQEDLVFLQNLKTVLNTKTQNEDPEAALANRIIALAVERSLNEIQSDQDSKLGRTGYSTVPTTPIYRQTTTTTPRTTTTMTPRPTTTVTDITPSLEEDLKQFQEDTKLLQALLKATGQDPSKLNIPTLPPNVMNMKVSAKIPSKAEADLNLLSNLLASPSPLNEPFDSLTPKTNKPATVNAVTTLRPYGAKIAVKDELKNEQDDAKLLKTLVKLQGAQETTTLKSKIAITGQSTDEALQKLIAKSKSPQMMSDSTKTPVVSTEFGKSNDALLAALLKEQGFGPTTASSLDEQLRLAALLNQVVVTPKSRRTTTTPPPPQPQRRPVLDGLAWLWQQWRETAPGPGQARPTRRPTTGPSPGPSISSSTSNRVNWFGSGPFVGNAEEPSGNRIPLEPPRAANAEAGPGRGQLVTAAINVTRAFSQFLGAAIQGAAQTVQSVIRAGQRATAEAYTGGSG